MKLPFPHCAPVSLRQLPPRSTHGEPKGVPCTQRGQYHVWFRTFGATFVNHSRHSLLTDLVNSTIFEREQPCDCRLYSGFKFSLVNQKTVMSAPQLTYESFFYRMLSKLHLEKGNPTKLGEKPRSFVLLGVSKSVEHRVNTDAFCNGHQNMEPCPRFVSVKQAVSYNLWLINMCTTSNVDGIGGCCF